MSNLILKKHIELELNLPSINYEGKYKYKIIKKDLLGREYVVEESDWFNNIITDHGLYMLVARSFPTYNNGFIGDGTSAPAVSDNGMGSFLDQVQHSTYLNGIATGYPFKSNSDTPPYIARTIFYYRFNPPATTLRTVSEFGVGRISTTGYPNYTPILSSIEVFSRVLVPTPITQDIDQYLDVYYQLDNIPPAADYLTSVQLNNAMYDIVLRPSLINTNVWNSAEDFTYSYSHVYTGPIGTVLEKPTGLKNIQVWPQNGNPLPETNYVKYIHTIGISKTSVEDTPLGDFSSITFQTSNTYFQANITPSITLDTVGSIQIPITYFAKRTV